MFKNKKAFNLVELIITITILAILATIAYIYMSNYYINTRDSVRVTDLKSIQQSLDAYFVKNRRYPDTSDTVNVTYSGAVAWYQGSFGKATQKEVGMMSIVPLDPLTGNPYAYSITNQKIEYELGASVEGDNPKKADLAAILINKVYAGEQSLSTYIIGNYNGKIVKVSTGGLDYIITTPTIIASDLSDPDILNIIENKRLSFNTFSNLPATYSGITLNDNIFDFSGGNNIVFKGHFNELYSNKRAKMELYEKIAKRYNFSLLFNKGQYKIFAETYNDSLNPTEQYITHTCFIVGDLINDENNRSCIETKEDILVGQAYTGALLPNGETNYIGQWPLGDPYGYGQGLQTANHDRSPLGLKGGLNKTIGIKWKFFTKNKNASGYFGGQDINGDGKENILYLVGGKLFLGDIETGHLAWQSKVYDIKKILGVENIMGDGSKSIIVALGEDWWIGVINGKTGNLDWISNKVSGTEKKVKISWPGINYKVFDINGDGINEYHFKQRYKKYHSMRFFKSGNKVIGETLWSSQGFGNYNENVSDGYQPYVWSMGKINNKWIVGAKGSNSFSFYSNDVNPALPAPDKFKMPAFAKLMTGGDFGHGRSRSLGYFYDINGDGNDEYIARIDKELNNNKHSRIIVSGLDSSGNMKQFMSLSSSTGAINFHNPIALKNYNNPQDSYILTYGEDPVSKTNKWLLLKYNGINSSAYKKDSNENESFNYKIEYNKFDSNYTPVGIFNNGNKDYIVLRKGSYYYFYTFKGKDTFKAPLAESSIKVSGSFFGNTLFDNGYDNNRERNKDSGIFLASYDTNGNGKKEFVVAESGNFKFYEINDSGVNLIKQFTGYGVATSRQKYGITEDNKDMYVIDYNSTNNTINYYRTHSDSGDNSFIKVTNDTFYAGGETNDMVISKLGQGNDKYNRLMIKGVGMFDARNATPTNPPIKVSNEFFYSYDMDRDGENEIFKDGKAYTYNSPGNYTLKYNSQGRQGDFDGDGVLDKSYSYCTSTANYPNNLFYTFRSGKDNSQIIPDLDWGNGNGWCSGGQAHGAVSEDFNGDSNDDFAVGLRARSTRIVSFSGGNITEGNQVPRNYAMFNVAFDFDGDGIKEIVRGADDDIYVYKIDEQDKTKLNLLTKTSGKKVKTALWGSGGRGLSIPSFYRDKSSGKVLMAVRGVDGEVALYSWKPGQSQMQFLWKNYYVYAKKYSSDEQALNDGVVPVATADVLLGDFMHEGDPQVLVGGGDGYVYLIGTDGYIRRGFYIGSRIKRMIIGDTNEDLLLDIIIGAENGYVYQISSARLDPPVLVGDGETWDINKQSERQKAGVNFKEVKDANGYYIQLYNYTKKQPVFNFIDIGNKIKACVVSNDYSGDIGDCIKISKKFYLEKNVIYIWRVQAYNSEMSSPEAVSDGFYIE